MAVEDDGELIVHPCSFFFLFVDTDEPLLLVYHDEDLVLRSILRNSSVAGAPWLGGFGGGSVFPFRENLLKNSFCLDWRNFQILQLLFKPFPVLTVVIEIIFDSLCNAISLAATTLETDEFEVFLWEGIYSRTIIGQKDSQDRNYSEKLQLNQDKLRTSTWEEMGGRGPLWNISKGTSKLISWETLHTWNHIDIWEKIPLGLEGWSEASSYIKQALRRREAGWWWFAGDCRQKVHIAPAYFVLLFKH